MVSKNKDFILVVFKLILSNFEDFNNNQKLTFINLKSRLKLKSILLALELKKFFQISSFYQFFYVFRLFEYYIKLTIIINLIILNLNYYY